MNLLSTVSWPTMRRALPGLRSKFPETLVARILHRAAVLF